MKQKKIIILLIILVLLASILRLYKLPQRQYWMIDEERDAFIVKKILVDKHPTLIGGALPGGFYLAPGYFYISAFLYYFSSLNPVGMGIVAALFGTFTVPLIFYIAKNLFDAKVGLLSALFYTFSYLTVIYNRTWWPLTFSPIVALVSYYSLYRIIKNRNFFAQNLVSHNDQIKTTFFNKRLLIKGNSPWIILLSIALIVGVQSDPSNFSLFFLVIIIWCVFKLPIRTKEVYIALTLFIVSHLPLLIFDLRHNFLNSHAILKFFSGKTGAGINFDIGTFFETMVLVPRSFIRFLWVFGQKDVALQIMPADIYIKAKFAAIPLIFLVMSVSVLIWFFIRFAKKGRKDIGIYIIGLHLIVALLGIALQNFFFGNWNFEWILQVLFPAYAIIWALFLKYLLGYKLLNFPIFLILLLFSFLATRTILQSPNSYNLSDKLKAVGYVVQAVGTNQFSLDSIGQNFSLGGYRYLFFLAGKEPIKSYMDFVYAGWLYPKRNNSTHPDIVAVIVNREICVPKDCLSYPEFESKYQSYLARTKQKARFGNIEVLIVDNSDNWVKW